MEEENSKESILCALQALRSFSIIIVKYKLK